MDFKATSSNSSFMLRYEERSLDNVIVVAASGLAQSTFEKRVRVRRIEKEGEIDQLQQVAFVLFWNRLP